MPATSTTTSKLQSANLDAYELLGKMDSLATKFQDEYLGTGADTRQYLLRQRDKAAASGAGFLGLDDEDRKWLTGRTGAIQEMKRLFNAYRKFVTGAAASPSELIDLEKSMFNENQGPTEWRAAYKSFREEVARGIRLRNRLLREGFNLGSSKYQEKIKAAIDGGIDDNDATAQFNYLRESEGLSPDDAIERLMGQGYDLGYLEDAADE